MKIWLVIDGYIEGDYIDGYIVNVLSSEDRLQKFKQDNDDVTNLHFIEWNIVGREE